LLLKPIGASSLRPLPFQMHLKSTQEPLLSWATTCVPPFKQLVEKQIDHLKESILERLHDHSLTNILFYLPFNSHRSCLKLCAGPSAGTWLLVRWIIPFFHLLLYVFSIALRTRLGFSRPLVLGVLHCICSQPLDPMKIHLFHCAHHGERMASHDVVRVFFATIVKDARFMFHNSISMSSRPFPSPYNLCINESTSSY
jgi:hypothetical protein